MIELGYRQAPDFSSRSTAKTIFASGLDDFAEARELDTLGALHLANNARLALGTGHGLVLKRTDFR